MRNSDMIRSAIDDPEKLKIVMRYINKKKEEAKRKEQNTGRGLRSMKKKLTMPSEILYNAS
jgi:hypothetical protein